MFGFEYIKRGVDIYKFQEIGFSFDRGIVITRSSAVDDQNTDLKDQTNTHALGETYISITISTPLYMGINYHLLNGMEIALLAEW